MEKTQHLLDPAREEDIRAVLNGVLTASVRNTGDQGSGGECPFCYKDCIWNADSVSDIEHEPNCIVLIAKDLSTGILTKAQ